MVKVPPINLVNIDSVYYLLLNYPWLLADKQKEPVV
jgi:hypothetical protein